jgi:acetylornithine aminotransferase
VFQPGKHASTFGGSPLACAAALETIRVIEDEHLIERAQKSGELFRAGLEAFVGGPVLEVRGKGLMLGMVLDRPAKPLTDLLAEQGLLALATAGNVVRFLPPLNIKDSELEEGLDILGDSLEQWQAGGPAEESAEASAEPESDDAGNAAGGE